MKTLIRSCFVASPNDKLDDLLQNYTKLYSSGLDMEVEEDNSIWDFIKDFVRTYNHVPDINSIRSHFKLYKQDSVTSRLDHLSSIPSIIQGDFTTRLLDRGRERRTRLVAELLKEAGNIATTGIEKRNGKEITKLQGPEDALRHIVESSHNIMIPTLGAKQSGEVTRDGVDFRNEYKRVSSDPLSGVGQHTGIEQMDTALNGAKKYELWVHAGFTGHLKSGLMLNWVYNQAIWYNFSSLVFSLEMPYQQVRRILYSIHSSHTKFGPIRHKLGMQSNPLAVKGLPYADIRDGTLAKWHKNAEKFLNDYVIPDFNGTRLSELDGAVNPATGQPWNDPSTYGKIHIEVADPDKIDFTMNDLRQRAELIYNQNPFNSIFLDHAGLMSPRRWANSTTDRLNEVIRDCKKLAMSFNRGQGIPVITLFQLSREGYKSALKAKEKNGKALYDLTSLSYANECERSADIVTASWLDDEFRNANRVQFQCLKSRDQKPFETFTSRVEWDCRRVVTCYDASPTPQQNERVGQELDGVKALDD